MNGESFISSNIVDKFIIFFFINRSKTEKRRDCIFIYSFIYFASVINAVVGSKSRWLSLFDPGIHAPSLGIIINEYPVVSLVQVVVEFSV